MNFSKLIMNNLFLASYFCFLHNSISQYTMNLVGFLISCFHLFNSKMTGSIVIISFETISLVLLLTFKPTYELKLSSNTFWIKFHSNKNYGGLSLARVFQIKVIVSLSLTQDYWVKVKANSSLKFKTWLTFMT